ncbi:hypothetical protein IFM46972_00279, partial [Aspergillus udagawae]
HLIYLFSYSDWLDHHSAQTTTTAPTSCASFGLTARSLLHSGFSERKNPPPTLLSLDPSTAHSPQSPAPDLISTSFPVLPVSFEHRLILILFPSITLS